jgi:hypothetical protein
MRRMLSASETGSWFEKKIKKGGFFSDDSFLPLIYLDETGSV